MIHYSEPRFRLAWLGVATLVLAGCTSTTTSPGPRIDGRPPSYAVFTGTLHLRGEMRVDGQFTDALTGRGETCSDYAYGNAPATTLWVTPTPNNAELVAGHAVSFTAGVGGTGQNFHGPGLYSQPSAQVDVLLVDNASFLAGDAPTTVITVTAAGAGSMAFSGLVDTYSGTSESGTETWTCTSGETPFAAASPGALRIVTPPGAPALQGMITIAGAYPSSAGFLTHAEVQQDALSGDTASHLTCADYARGTLNSSDDSRSFIAPEVDTGGANSVYFIVSLNTGYAGPGTYSSDSFPALAGAVEITIPPISAPQIDTFISRYGGSTVLTVMADGSGTVQLTNWASGASDSRISATVAWTCAA